MKSIRVIAKFSGENSSIFRNNVADRVSSALAGIDNSVPFHFLQTDRDISIDGLEKIRSGYFAQSIGGNIDFSQKLFFCSGLGMDKIENNFLRILSSSRDLFSNMNDYDVKIDLLNGGLDLFVQEKGDFLQYHHNLVKGGSEWLSKFDIKKLNEEEDVENLIKKRAYVLDNQGIFSIPEFNFPSFEDYPDSIMDYLKGQYEVMKSHHKIESRSWDNGPTESFEDFKKKMCSRSNYTRDREMSEIDFNQGIYDGSKEVDLMAKRLFEQKVEIASRWSPPIEYEGPYSGKGGLRKNPKKIKVYGPGPDIDTTKRY